MTPPTIRPARQEEYDEIARVWMNSWASTGLEDASNFLLAKLRARIPLEIEKGWSLYVADDDGAIAAMLALHLPDIYLDQLFVAPEYQGRTSAGNCSPSPGSICPTKSGCAACARTKRPGAGMSARVLCSKRKRWSHDGIGHEILSLEEIDRAEIGANSCVADSAARLVSKLRVSRSDRQSFQSVLSGVFYGSLCRRRAHAFVPCRFRIGAVAASSERRDKDGATCCQTCRQEGGEEVQACVKQAVSADNVCLRP